MARSVDALVNPQLLVWARLESGLTIDAVAKKLHVTPERLQSWESGDRKPTIKQLRKLANAYKRPLAVFYLARPPEGFRPLRDFRQLLGEAAGATSPKLRNEIRRAHHRRQIAIELHEALLGPPPSFSLRASLNDDYERLSMNIRKDLGVHYEDQITWRKEGARGPFNRWRSALEGLGVLVFQAEEVELEEMRGFSISEVPLPAIIVNVKDSPNARVFTIIHELIHLMLHEGSLCNLRGEEKLPRDERRIEVFCNMVAGAVLVPAHYLLKEELVLQRSAKAEWPDGDLNVLSIRYGVSREVILRRLLICGRTTNEFYAEKREDLYRMQDEEKPVRAGKTWGPPPHTRAVSRAGSFFVRLVLDNYYQDKITLSDVSEYLGVRLKHLRNIEAAVMG